MSFYFNNDEDAPVWYYSAFSKAGAYCHAKTLMQKFNVTIIEPPRYDETKDLWYFSFTNPFNVSS